MDLPIRRQDPDDMAPDFERLRRRFANQLEHWPAAPLPGRPDAVLPLADVEETDGSYLIDVELPGVRREDVELQVDQGRLRVTGLRRERERVGLLRHRTRTTGRFSLTITLPGSVDRDGVTASLDSGMLHVVVPKTAGARRRRIAVGGADLSRER